MTVGLDTVQGKGPSGSKERLVQKELRPGFALLLSIFMVEVVGII
jgi:hypothetical protein